MKGMIASLLLICAFFTVQAQTVDTTLKAYTGTYKFPEGSFVTSAEITLTNNVLSVNSDKGSSTLERRGKDTFALTSYNGMVYFFRDTEGKVARVKVAVEDMLLEGTKENSTAWIQKKSYWATTKQLQGK